MQNLRTDIKQAIKKLKSQVYYDKSNTNLNLRKQLVTYLGEHGKGKLEESVINLLSDPNNLECYLDSVSYVVIPKRIKSQNQNEQFVTNHKIEKDSTVEDVNLIIDAPIEIHVLSVLWLMRIGYNIDKNLPDSCFGNRLLLDNDQNGIVQGRGLLKPYHRQYQLWRDKGVAEAKNALQNGNDATFINLDISSYYYNVRLNWDDLSNFVDKSEQDRKIHDLMFRLHKRYTRIVVEATPDKLTDLNIAEFEVLLPIGLFSSYTLANHYLKSFDDDVRKLSNCSYYGRYVDDIVFVLSDLNSQEISDQELNSYLRNYNHDDKLIREFEKSEKNLFSRNTTTIIKNLSSLFKVEIDPKTDKLVYSFRSKNYQQLRVQQSKVMIYEFKAGFSQSVIDKLQKDIEERSSEFRRLPTSNQINFDKEVYELLFDNSFGKPRTLKDYKENHVGLSTYLYKATTLGIWNSGSVLSTEIEKVLSFFRGSNLITYYQHWERLFTLLVVTERKKDLVTLVKNIFDEINHLNFPRSQSILAQLRKTLSDYLSTSLAQSFALKADILKDKWFSDRLNKILGSDSNWLHTLTASTLAIRNFWFIRSTYVIHPLIEFTNWAQSKNINSIKSLIDTDFDWSVLNQESFKLANEPNPYPRFFNLYEVSHYLWLYKIVQNNHTEILETSSFTHAFINEAFEKFCELNNIPKGKLDLDEAIKELSGIVDKKRIENHNNIQELHFQNFSHSDISINKDEKQEIHVGLANIKVKWEHEAEYSLRGRPLVKLERLERVYRILEKFRSEKPKTDLAIFPEISIPYAFTSALLWFAKNYQFGLIFGLEHINTGKFAYNFIATVLPIKLRSRQDAIFIPRLKNHYSHEELSCIRANHVIAIKNSDPFYHLFKWRNLYFTTFYCFELADIVHRSWFRSKVDLLVASEFNKDVNYFSSIIDSTSRDLSTYVAQVNSSDFGDNRLTRPAKTIHKNLIRLDGGENDLVIIASINLNEFRKHLEVGYEIQKDAKVYKPSPPNFDHEMVKRRIRGEWVQVKK